jgi:hypothetical protein
LAKTNKTISSFSNSRKTINNSKTNTSNYNFKIILISNKSNYSHVHSIKFRNKYKTSQRDITDEVKPIKVIKQPHS